MNIEYHIQACKDAFGNEFSDKAFETIIAANIGQDDLKNLLQFNFHFDNDFAPTWKYIEKQREILFNNLDSDKIYRAWEAFGRITHATQDFYSHSNYVKLWTQNFVKQDKFPSPIEINALDPELLEHPELTTSKIYLPFEMITYWKRFRSFASRHLPKDSHTNMNLDHPGRGPLFPYAQAAATKRLKFDYAEITNRMDNQQLRTFKDQ